MFKLSRLLTSRHQLLEALSSRKDYFRDCLRNRHGFTYLAGFSTATDNYAAKGYTSNRIFAPYSIYKGKAALSLSPCLPTFTKLDSGAVVVDRRGSIMMIFMPAVGDRKYDWEKRQRFALSATEVGSLITMGPQDSCEFFHDPSMLSSNAGQVMKSLSIKPHANSNGYFVSLTVVNKLLNTKDYLTVPVTTAEFAVMKTACSLLGPAPNHLSGFGSNHTLCFATHYGLGSSDSSAVQKHGWASIEVGPTKFRLGVAKVNYCSENTKWILVCAVCAAMLFCIFSILRLVMPGEHNL